MNTTPFTKIEATGNDFILFDHGDRQAPEFSTEEIRSLCNRNFGIGADGLITLGFLDTSEAFLGFFNSDGSAASMCGNALRAVGAYLKEEYRQRETTLHLGGRAHTVVHLEDSIYGASFPMVSEITEVKPAEAGSCYFLNTGTEHVVMIVDDLEHTDVLGLGRVLRYHSLFAPRGANANFVKILTPDSLAIRTYERGVEEETLSCGSGSVAAALVAKHLGLVAGSEIRISNRSPFETLISIKEKALPFEEIKLIGPARVVFSGRIQL
jgi:diaminopimelate epimerase